MSSAPESAAPLPSFLERFLEDRSIKWMLGLGMLVLLGSSLKFVTHHWESYSPFWKYVVLMAYAAAVYGLAEIGLHRLQLRRTGTGLMALTLGLLPLTFLSLRWVAPGLPTDLSGIGHDVGLAGLLCANLAFTAFASRRILQTLLHLVPTTYWLSYLTLCVSGALAPAVPDALAPVAATALWAVFTLGVVKVNRHVFWLAEEERWPRIFAFFPTGLLAAQFVLLFALNFAPAISTPWLGLGLALVAVPVLLTADAAAAVFQQRSGAIVYPWPTPVISPLLVGLGLCACGIGLAMSDLPRPIALSPTTILSALCLWAVARRTGHRVFSWAMLLCLLAAYQFLPVYFQQFARQVVQTSAEMVHERRLPYAFYGITYAPFILGLLLAGRWLKAELFAAPCRQLAVSLAMVMLLASWTDAKAMFITGSVLTVLWLLMRLAFGDKRLDWGLGITWLSAAAGLEAFLRDVCQWEVPGDFWWWSMAAAAGVLGVASLWQRDDEITYPVFERLGLLALGVLVYRWMWHWGLQISPDGTACLAAILTLIAWHQGRRVFPFVGEGLLVIAGWAAVRYGLAMGVNPVMLWLLAAIVMATGWALSQGVTPLADRTLVQAFGFPLRRVSTWGLAASQLAVLSSLAVFPAAQFTMAFWLIAAIVCGWSFAAAGRTLPVRWVQLGCISSLMLIGRGLEAVCGPTVAVNWLPVLWGFAIVTGGIVARRINQSSPDAVMVEVAQSVDRLAHAIEWLLALATLCLLTGPARFAAVLVLGSLAWRSRQQTTPWSRHALLELCFLQIAVALLSMAVPQQFLWLVPVEIWHSVQIVGTLLAAVWLFTLQSNWLQRFLPDRSLLDVETTFWELIAGFSTVTLLFTQSRPMELMDAVPLTLLFGVLTATGLRSAVRNQNADMAWMSLAVAAAGLGYLVWFDVVSPFNPVMLGGLLATSCLLTSLGGQCRQSVRYGVLAQPFWSVGDWLPAAVAILCITGGLTHLEPHRPGIDSFIVLTAAAIYFVRWIERRDTISLLAATAVFNAAQILLWRQLAWSDPQLYLMPLGLSLIAVAEGLPRELKIEVKTTLRYAGALVILVSPLFHILDGGWLPLLTLMAASLGVSVLALGLKSRPLLYSGTSFLIADLAALVVRGSLERTDILWIAGIGLGSSVIALAAYCENHRELVLQRMRLLAATLQTWD